jgi:hypothetical protein
VACGAINGLIAAIGTIIVTSMPEIQLQAQFFGGAVGNGKLVASRKPAAKFRTPAAKCRTPAAKFRTPAEIPHTGGKIPHIGGKFRTPAVNPAHRQEPRGRSDGDINTHQVGEGEKSFF